MRTVTLVPYRPATDLQVWAWDHTRPALEALDFPLYTGEPRGEEWARGQAVNVASERAGDWDVALIADCDTIPDPGSIRRAITWVQDTGGAARPHSERIMLNRRGSVMFAQRGPGSLDRHHFAGSHAGGGLLVLTREAWDTVGGFDETWLGWGAEDSCLNLRLLRHSTWDRLPGTAWHLHHPTDGNRSSYETRMRYQELLVEYQDDIARWAQDKGLRHPERVF